MVGEHPSNQPADQNPSTGRSEGVQGRRIQRKRSKGWTRGDAVCVDRSSRFGNPFAVYRDLDGWRIHVLYVTDGRFPEEPAFGTKAEAVVRAVELYTAWLKGELVVAGIERRRRWILDNLHRLHGRDLCCYCAVPADGGVDWCHAATLLALANGGER
jgi:hypothetical protein